MPPLAATNAAFNRPPPAYAFLIIVKVSSPFTRKLGILGESGEIEMEQILINLIAGALGGAATGKASPTFDLGTVGNIISGLVGGGVLGQIATLALPSVVAAVQSGNWSVGRGGLTAGRRWRWRGHTHGDHRRDQEQSRCLALGSLHCFGLVALRTDETIIIGVAILGPIWF
jgi:hypothetical protein